VKGADMKKHLSWISVVGLIALVGTSACSSPQTISTPVNMETPLSTETPLPTKTQLDQESLMRAKLDQLVTVKDINSFSEDLGIIQWQIDDESAGEYRVCRVFRGQSWSINRNLAANCIWQMNPGITFQDTIDWLISSKSLPDSAKVVVSAYDYEDDFGLYAWLGSNGHSVYDGLLLKDDFLYWAEIDVGTPGGFSPETLFASKYGEPVDTFLHEVLMANLTRGE
jgi:hypothetical protein